MIPVGMRLKRCILKMPRKKIQVYKCVPCGAQAKDKVHEQYFSYQNVNGKVVIMCWDCADKLHWDTITKERELGMFVLEQRLV